MPGRETVVNVAQLTVSSLVIWFLMEQLVMNDNIEFPPLETNTTLTPPPPPPELSTTFPPPPPPPELSTTFPPPSVLEEQVLEEQLIRIRERQQEFGGPDFWTWVVWSGADNLRNGILYARSRAFNMFQGQEDQEELDGVMFSPAFFALAHAHIEKTKKQTVI